MKNLIFILLIAPVLNTFSAPQKRSLPFEKEYRVVLMLPFCLGMPEKSKLSDAMVGYYEGVEMAIKDLDAMGMKMNLIVLDTRQDSLEVIRLLQDPDMQKSDLIIGPVYDNEMVEVVKFCATYKIPLVSPLRYVPNTIGADFPLINCIPADSLMYLYVGMNAARSFKGFQAVAVDETGTGISASGARNFKKGFEAVSGKTVKIIDGKTNTITSVWNNKDSVLVFYAGKTSVSVSNGLNTRSLCEKSIILGPADWLNIERSSYNGFNGVYFYDPYFANNSDSSYRSFRRNFRDHFGGDPDRYTLIGYDQFNFFGLALMAWDNQFYQHVLERNFDLTHSTYRLHRRGNLIENAGTNFFYYNNYNLYRASWRY